jgi:uncharacterized protein (TIGR03435 family)
MTRRALLAIATITATHALALSAQAPSDLRFEVASVRRVEVPSNAFGVPVFPTTGGVGTAEPLRISYRATWLGGLIAAAFGFPSDRIVYPAGTGSDRYDIIANIPEGATQAEFNVMLGNLLRDRFHLKFHVESKNTPVYALRIAKNGLKLKQTVRRADNDTPARATGADAEGFPVLPQNFKGMVGRPGTGEMFWAGQDVSMSEIARFLQERAGRPVVDETGLTARYDLRLHIEWGRPSAALAAPSSAPSVFSAVDEQLGLKLESSSASLDYLIVDSLDREPTEN